MKNTHDHGHIFFDYDDQKPMTLEKAIEVLKVHQNWVLGEDSELLKISFLNEAIPIVLAELERVTKKLKEVLPNGGFVVKNCPNTMIPTTLCQSPTYIVDYFKQMSNDNTPKGN